MAREKTKCPGCECKVSLAEVEKNDGACPECGQQLFGFQSSLFEDYEEEEDDLELEEQELSDFDEDEEEDDFDDDDDYDDDDDDEDEDDED